MWISDSSEGRRSRALEDGPDSHQTTQIALSPRSEENNLHDTRPGVWFAAQMRVRFLRERRSRSDTPQCQAVEYDRKLATEATSLRPGTHLDPPIVDLRRKYAQLIGQGAASGRLE